MSVPACCILFSFSHHDVIFIPVHGAVCSLMTFDLAQNVCCRLTKANRQNQRPVRGSSINAPWGQPQPIDNASSPNAKQRANKASTADLTAAPSSSTGTRAAVWSSQPHSSTVNRSAGNTAPDSTGFQEATLPLQHQQQVYGQHAAAEWQPDLASMTRTQDLSRSGQAQGTALDRRRDAQQGQGGVSQQRPSEAPFQPSFGLFAQQAKEGQDRSKSQHAEQLSNGRSSYSRTDQDHVLHQGTAANRQLSPGMQSTVAAQDKKALLPAKPYATEQSLKVSPAKCCSREFASCCCILEGHQSHDCCSQLWRALSPAYVHASKRDCLIETSARHKQHPSC